MVNYIHFISLSPVIKRGRPQNCFKSSSEQMKTDSDDCDVNIYLHSDEAGRQTLESFLYST